MVFPTALAVSERQKMDKLTQASGIEDALRQRLLATGASQPQIAQETGVPQTTVSRFLRGLNPPNMRTYEALLKFVIKRDTMAAAGMPVNPLKGRRAARGIRGQVRP
jgi:transcriptional regulator with XRE-family HTH domain